MPAPRPAIVRILRSWLLPRRRRRRFDGKTVLVMGASLVLGVFWIAERFPEGPGDLARLTAVRTLEGRVTHVRDGDTIEVAGVPIRFGSLDCAERGTIEGRKATARMRRLTQGRRVSCALNGRRSYDRYIGSCTLPDGRDLAAILRRERLCRRF